MPARFAILHLAPVDPSDIGPSSGLTPLFSLSLLTSASPPAMGERGRGAPPSRSDTHRASFGHGEPFTAHRGGDREAIRRACVVTVPHRGRLTRLALWGYGASGALMAREWML